MFSQNVRGNLEYKKTVQDQKRPDVETGHVATFGGDSGSPYFTKDTETLVAIHRGRTQGKLGKTSAWYTNDPYYQCRIVATKVTHDMLSWAEERENEVLGGVW